jgi:hypothetical protein
LAGFVVVVVVDGNAVVVVVDLLDFDFFGGGGAGTVAAFTEKSVPVTTVTSARPSTIEWSKPKVTAPDMEFATSCAAATTAGDRDP